VAVQFCTYSCINWIRTLPYVRASGVAAHWRACRPTVDPVRLTAATRLTGKPDHFDFGDNDAVAWTYDEPEREVAPIAGRVAFYNERVDLEVDGEPQQRPVTPFSR
jgi:hypothetical protein